MAEVIAVGADCTGVMTKVAKQKRRKGESLAGDNRDICRASPLVQVA